MVLLCFTGGCRSLDETVPPVERIGVGESAVVAELEAGRVIYLVDCAKCHVPEPVAKYTWGRWEEILAKMVPETKLSAEESSRLAAYIKAVLHRPRPKR